MKNQYDIPLGPMSEIELCNILNTNGPDMYKEYKKEWTCGCNIMTQELRKNIVQCFLP